MTPKQDSTLLAIVLSLLLFGCGGPPAPNGPPTSDSSAAAPVETAPPAAEQPTADAADATVTPIVRETPQVLDAALLDDGWIALFDGHSTFGWQAHSNANWRVEQGALVVDEGEQGLLCTTNDFSDYVLSVDFQADPETNSGVFLRTATVPMDPATDCYELNIAPPDNPFPTGGLVARKRTAEAAEHLREGWQTYEVTVQGAQVSVRLNGAKVLQYEDEARLRRGRIGLQFNQGRVAFRNVRLKPLGTHPLFNGRDLTGWETDDESVGEYTVEDGAITIRGGPGQLETSSRHADFVLQLECKTNLSAMNSGIFFRCIPGDRWMGYESQIHNGFEDGNRAQPSDHGSGGIFRRQLARVVVADDKTWFHKTIVATGPNISVWVNGYQVSSWTDQRPADPNPRRGLRLEAGTILIQAHDPRMDLATRGWQVADLPAR